MNIDKFSAKTDTIAGAFMTGYMLFLCGMFIVLACLPSLSLVPGKQTNIPVSTSDDVLVEERTGRSTRLVES